jgi:6-phosphofructokinase 1
MNVIGIMRGYQGLIDKEFVKFTSSSVSNTIQRGGTPSAYDRILASRMGYAAIEALL